MYVNNQPEPSDAQDGRSVEPTTHLRQFSPEALALLFEQRDRARPDGRTRLKVLPPHVLAVVPGLLPSACGSNDGVEVIEVLLHVVLLEQLLAVLLVAVVDGVSTRHNAFVGKNRTVIDDSRRPDTRLKIVAAFSGCSSHHSEKHSAKSSYLQEAVS